MPVGQNTLSGVVTTDIHCYSKVKFANHYKQWLFAEIPKSVIANWVARIYIYPQKKSHQQQKGIPVMTINTEEIKWYVEQHIKEVKTIHSVSTPLQLSYDTLRKSFLRKERIPLADYIVQRKIQAMKDLLVTADHPCFYICYEYGYREDTGAKVFKRNTGMTMLEYKRWFKENGGNTFSSIDPKKMS